MHFSCALSSRTNSAPSAVLNMLLKQIQFQALSSWHAGAESCLLPGEHPVLSLF